jgi:CelD/BcsL family acetyltransferase involved in cellulose biosynthesis
MVGTVFSLRNRRGRWLWAMRPDFYAKCEAMAGQSATKLLLLPSDERWVAFVNSMPNANVFHHPVWINLLAEFYGYRPFVIAVCNEEGEVKAGVPLMEVNSPLTGRRWVSLPFTDHCTPLYRGDTLPRELFEYLSGLQINLAVPRVEIRGAIPYDDQVHRDNNQVLHLLRLSGEAQKVFRNFHRSQVKRNIARAEREGIKVRRGENERDLDTFYDLHLKTRHRLGVPVQPKRYFESLWQRIINAGLGFILLAYKDSVPIAGGVFLTYKATLVYKYGASDEDYWPYRANHLLFWTAIRWGCEHGYSLFDWGKTSISNTGLRNFKSGWGAQESILTYSVLSATPPHHIAERLSGLTGTFIRHAPRWVCRVTGELLYKHFA